MSIRKSTRLVTKSARRGRMRLRSPRIWWNLYEDGWSHWLWKSATVSSVELRSRASARSCRAPSHSMLEFRSRARNMRLQVRAWARARAPSTLHFSPMRLPERSSSESWQSSLRSVPRCLAPSAPSSLHLRSRTRRVLFSMRKETSCRTPSSRILCLPRRISTRWVSTRSIRPRCTVCSSCSVPIRGFPRSQTHNRAPPTCSAAATATSTSMSSSASAMRSSCRGTLTLISSTTARPPALPSGFRERSRCCRRGQGCSARHTAVQPSGPMEFAQRDRLCNCSAWGPSRPSASCLAPSSVRRPRERSKRVRSGALAPKACMNTAMSGSPSREVNVVAWHPGASTKKLSVPISADSSRDRTTR
mmetsp:Transcript_71329/g.212757  ORF Transcript_71329/g.212757 Transcript_71329/m.212757 type:complete len:361 (+) Transcript_71329:139-1221(+)